MAGNVQKKLMGWAVLAAASCVVIGCDRPASADGQVRRVEQTEPDSMGVVPRDVRTIAMHVRRELSENSAAVMSARQPGVVFTINDSGNDPVLFAFDTSGADRGAWRVSGATNVDWESASLGACASTVRAGETCLYIGDTGDNQAHHKSRAIYRVTEPDATGGTGSVDAERLSYVYPDGPHDVEAMYVARNGDILLITKRPIFDRAGRTRQSLVFRLAPSAWGTKGNAIAELVDSLPIVPGSAPLREVTDASLAPDARHLAVRTYTQVFVFSVDPATGRVVHAVRPSVCNVVPLGERQGEGITWANAAGRLIFTSEGRTAPLYIATCPVPAATR